MIEDMEAKLTELSEINSKTDNLSVTEEADVDEPSQFILKWTKTQAYQRTMNIDFKNINTFLNRNKVYTK